MPVIDKARRAAAAALVKVHRGGWTAAAADGVLAGPSLAPRDRAFAGALFFGATERLATLDALLVPLLSRPIGKLDIEVRAILETGLYQMLYMRVPARASVDESVKLAKAFGKSSASGLVNAVLRSAATLYAAKLPQDTPPNDIAPLLLDKGLFTSEEDRVRLVWSVSRAVASAVMDSLPGDYDAFFGATFSDATLALRVNTLKTTPEELERELGRHGAQVRPGPLPGSLLADIPGGVAGEVLFTNGFYHVQGLASQYAVTCLAPKPGMKVLDLCAAPGGKSATIAEELGGGEGLTLCDLSAPRLALALDGMERLGIEGAEAFVNDAARYNPNLLGQDAVLCDVPCSGLGVLGQKPDLRYATGDNFAALPDTQLGILSTASRYVREGGRLVYSTCTIRREENEDVVERFLKCNNGFRLLPPLHRPDGAEITDGMMTILPQKAGMDGFFVATLERL